MLRLSFALVFLGFAISLAHAEPAEFKPGKYVRDGGSGWLIIQKNKKNEFRFEIESIGANCHMCDVSGVIRKGVGYADRWDEDEEEPQCLISFSGKASSIVVEVGEPSQKACHAYCGFRAGFTGTYTIPPAACTRANRQAERDRFLALYRSRQYAEAASTLDTLIQQCKKFMNWIEIDQVRSDLALSQYHNHEAAQCLATLDDTLAAGAKDEEELKSGEGSVVHLPPCDFDNYIDVAKAIWFNQALCRKGAAGTADGD